MLFRILKATLVIITVLLFIIGFRVFQAQHGDNKPVFTGNGVSYLGQEYTPTGGIVALDESEVVEVGRIVLEGRSSAIFVKREEAQEPKALYFRYKEGRYLMYIP